jgi:hypothetical protein
VRVVIFGVANCKKNTHTRNTVWEKYRFVKAPSVKTNKTTAMLSISAASYTNWMGYELVTEIKVLLTDSLSIADCNALPRPNNIMTEGSQRNECDKQP